MTLFSQKIKDNPIETVIIWLNNFPIEYTLLGILSLFINNIIF